MAEPRTHSRMRFSAALLAATGMMLTACTVEPGEEPSNPTASSSTGTETAASPTAQTAPTASVEPELNADQLTEILLPADQLPGEDQTERSVESFEDQPFTMYFTLRDFSPTGQCSDEMSDLNEFNTPALNGVTGHYALADEEASASPSGEETADSSEAPEPEEPGTPTVEIMVLETAADVQPMTVYPEIAEACGELGSDEVEGSTASFTQLGSLDAVQLSVDDGSGETETLYAGGDTVGNHHVYIAASGMNAEDAETLFTEQIEQLRETLEDDASASPADSATASPTS